MDFGQTLDDQVLKNTDWRLPKLQSPQEQAQLDRLKRASERMALKGQSKTPVIRIGAPVWGEPKWVGNLYPLGTKTNDFISAYQNQFKTVEVNSTFYAVPQRSTFQKWYTAVNSDFRFCPKFPKTVSHQIGSVNSVDLEKFYQGLESLRDKIGMTFLQLPGTFSAAMGDRRSQQLLSFLDSVPRWAKVGIEFRNPVFFDQQRLKPEWVDALAQRLIATVIVDTPTERPVCHVSLSSNRVMVRFLGANLHDTEWPRLDEWAERCATWIENGLKELYFIVHEPDIFYSAKSTQYFIRALNQQMKKKSLDLWIEEPVWQDLFDGSFA